MFCENCGRQLQDGEVCTCTQQAPAVNEQPAPEAQAPAAPQPQYYQPQPQPVYQPTPAPEAQAPAAPQPQAYQPQPQPVYQPTPAPEAQAPAAPQPAPVQPAYSQPAPAQAPQPVYQQPAPAYQQTQPAYQQAYQPVAKPVAQRAYSYGTPRYNVMAQFLSSPVILVFAILYSLDLLIRLIGVAVSFDVFSIFRIIAILIDSLFVVGALICFASARGYISKGTPISPAGLTIASGLSKAYGIVFIVISSILTIAILIVCVVEESAIPLVAMVVPIAMILVIIYYFSLSNAFKSIRHEISNTPCSRGVSLYTVVFKCIGTAFAVIGLIFTVVITSTTAGILGLINRGGILYDLRSALGRDLYDAIMSFFNYSDKMAPVTIISSILEIVLAILGIVVLVKARQAKAQTLMMKE